MGIFEDNGLSPDEFLNLEKEEEVKPVGSLGFALKAAFEAKPKSDEMRKKVEEVIDRRDYAEKMRDYILKCDSLGEDIVIIEWTSWYSQFTDGEGRLHDYITSYLKEKDYYFTGAGVLITRKQAKEIATLRMKSKYSLAKIREFKDKAIQGEAYRVSTIARRQKEMTKWVDNYVKVTGCYPPKEETDNYLPPELFKKTYSSIIYMRPCSRKGMMTKIRVFEDSRVQASIIEIIDQTNT